MQKHFRIARNAISIVTVASALSIGTVAMAEGEKAAKAAAPTASALLEEGKKLAFGRKKGNCLACHMIPGGEMAGTIGPPLIAMKARMTKEVLKAQIADPRTKTPNSIMPPFGAHGILTPEELDKVVDYIHSL